MSKFLHVSYELLFTAQATSHFLDKTHELLIIEWITRTSFS